MKYTQVTLVITLMSFWWHVASASAVKSCDTIVEVLEKVECSSDDSCEISFKSKCTFNNRGHSMGTCKFKSEKFRTQVKIPAGNFSFKKGDSVKLSYFLVCSEEGCGEPEWKYLGIEGCGFWRSLF